MPEMGDGNTGSECEVAVGRGGVDVGPNISGNKAEGSSPAFPKILSSPPSGPKTKSNGLAVGVFGSDDSGIGAVLPVG
jgi:hypothetical protein